MTDVLGLPADLATALTLITTVVVIPAVTAVLTSPRTPAWARRVLPIALAAVGALGILLLRGDLTAAPESLTAWIMLAATLVGGAQALYALMPTSWRALAAATSTSRGRHADRDGVMDGRDTPRTSDRQILSEEEVHADHHDVPCLEDSRDA